MDEQVISKPINGWDYQNTDRIFYKEGFYYDYAVQINRAPDQSEDHITIDLTLLSGNQAELIIEIFDEDTFHFEFKNKIGSYEMDSDTYLPKTLLPVKAELFEENDRYKIVYKELTIEFLKEPFQIVVKKSNQIKLATSIKKVSRQFITPGIGQRIDQSGKSEAFISWNIQNEENFYGLGEKFGQVEKSQSRITGYAMDACGTNTTDLAYKNYPILLSTKGYGMIFDTARRNHWDIGSFCHVSSTYLVESSVLRGYIFLGGNIKQLIEKNTSIIGRPEIPAPWTLGVWYSRCAYMNKTELYEVKQKLQECNLPFDVMNIDVHWGENYWYNKFWVDCCDFEWGFEEFPDPEQMFEELWGEGIACSAWINPYLPPGTRIYQEGLEKGYLVKTIEGGIAHITRRQVSEIGLPDLTNPAAYSWWKDHLKTFMARGIRVLKPDYTDRIPENALFANGYTGIDMHNMYIYLYVKACYEATQEIYGTALVWKRPGFIGTGKFTGTWSGDVEATFEGLKMTLRGGLSVGFVGETLWSSDIAGFKGEMPSEELYIRWSQVGLLCSLARYHGTTPREPWYFGEKAIEVVKKYSDLRYRWTPYLMELTVEAANTGLPVMRHLAIEYPEDPLARKIDDEYLLGDSILVVPILVEGQQERSIYLPAGNWYDIHSGSWYEGNKLIRVSITLEDIPIFIKEGSVIPTFKHDLKQLKDFVLEDIELTAYGTPADKKGTIVSNERTGIPYEIKDGQVKSALSINLVEK